MPSRPLPTPPSAPSSTRSSPSSSFSGHNSSARVTPVPKPEKSHEADDRRKHIVMEMVKTEKSYVENLGYLIEHFMNTLIQNAASFGETQETMEQIFGNIKFIYDLNKQLFENEFKKMSEGWTPQSCVGPIFKKIIPFLKMYTVYSNTYAAASDLCSRLMNNNQKFRTEVTNISQNSESKLKLPDYLIMPIQRIPRYCLLIYDLQKHTDKSHPDYKDLESAYIEIEAVATHINDEVRRHENNMRMEEMHRKGIDLGNFIQPTRSFIKDGVIKVKVESTIPGVAREHKATTEYRHFLLFNDILVHVRKDLIKNGSLTKPQFVWPVDLMWIETSSSTTITTNTTTNTNLTLTNPTTPTTSTATATTTILGPSERLTFIDNDEDKWTQAFESIIQAQLDQKMHITGKKLTSQLRFGEYTYPDGYGVYTGEWLNGKREGKGVFRFAGGVYKGFWKNNAMESKGKLKFFNGDVYIGNWSDGKFHGKGELRMSDGTRFCGEWAKGMRKGYGKMEYANGDIFKGAWNGDNPVEGEFSSAGIQYQGQFEGLLFHGTGHLKYPDGSEYEGEFRRGNREGLGSMKYSDKSSYQGYFSMDMRHGKGIHINPDGQRYVGGWANDTKHGFGRHEYAPNLIYEGNWEYSLRHGRGSYLDNNTYYEGEWLNDKPHGEGESLDPDGTVYKGSWVAGAKEGKGEFIFPNGASYIGGVFRGKFHQKGVFHGGDKGWIEQYDGEWALGNMHGKGKITYFNGDQCIGNFVNNTIVGDATYTFENGTVYDGKWNSNTYSGKCTITNRSGDFQGISSENQVSGISGGISFPLPPRTPHVRIVGSPNAIVVGFQ